ncbi:MAG: response regulator transcription factor [Deltaproteobacteria bacterium]|nr:response regulator transcription factor [Deltaproteobacteria bacterium]
MEALCRVVLAEDHQIFREGLRAIFASEEGIEVVGEAADGREAIRCADTLRPDLVILDLSMPRTGGLEALGEIKRVSPGTRVVVLTMHKCEEHVHAAFHAGADAYVLKDSGAAELLLAMRAVLSGGRYVCPEVAPQVVTGYLDSWKGAPRHRSDSLSSREREVLKLIAEGQSTREIACYLSVSLKTVEKHRAKAMRKLKLRTVSALIAYAFEKGIVIR